MAVLPLRVEESEAGNIFFVCTACKGIPMWMKFANALDHVQREHRSVRYDQASERGARVDH